MEDMSRRRRINSSRTKLCSCRRQNIIRYKGDRKFLKENNAPDYNCDHTDNISFALSYYFKANKSRFLTHINNRHALSSTDTYNEKTCLPTNTFQTNSNEDEANSNVLEIDITDENFSDYISPTIPYNFKDIFKVNVGNDHLHPDSTSLTGIIVDHNTNAFTVRLNEIKKLQEITKLTEKCNLNPVDVILNKRKLQKCVSCGEIHEHSNSCNENAYISRCRLINTEIITSFATRLNICSTCKSKPYLHEYNKHNLLGRKDFHSVTYSSFMHTKNIDSSKSRLERPKSSLTYGSHKKECSIKRIDNNLIPGKTYFSQRRRSLT